MDETSTHSHNSHVQIQTPAASFDENRSDESIKSNPSEICKGEQGSVGWLDSNFGLTSAELSHNLCSYSSSLVAVPGGSCRCTLIAVVSGRIGRGENLSENSFLSNQVSLCAAVQVSCDHCCILIFAVWA